MLASETASFYPVKSSDHSFSSHYTAFLHVRIDFISVHFKLLRQLVTFTNVVVIKVFISYL